MTRTRGPGLIIAVLLIGLLVAAGCGADNDEAATDSREAPSVASSGGADTSDESFAPANEAADGDDSTVAAGDTAQARLLRRNADLIVEVTDLTAATDTAIAAITTAGGYLSSQLLQPHESQMTLRVPGDDFDRILDSISELGTLRKQTVTTEDRTEVIVDLEARLETAEASLDRTRSFFEAAVTVDDLTTLEREMADREAQVASLQAQLDSERSSVALSTINVRFQLDPGVDPSDVVPSEDPLPGVVDALANGWETARSLGYLLVLAVVWLLPWLPLLVALGFGLRFWRRRRAARPPKPPKARPGNGSPPPPPPPAWTPPADQAPAPAAAPDPSPTPADPDVPEAETE